MKELAEAIVNAILGEELAPKAVVEEFSGSDTTMICIRGTEDVLGPIIGKEGRTAKAIRTILNVVAKRQGGKVVVDISNVTAKPPVAPV